MKIGDTFSASSSIGPSAETTGPSTDGRKRTWTVTESLGRGTWGRSFLVRDDDGHERVLKVALGPDDFPADTPLPAEVPKACRDALQEQAKLLERGDLPFLPRLEGRVTLADGRPGLLLPRYNATLGRRLEAGMPLTGVLQLVQRICRALATTGRVHGNLRPSNILLNDRGEPVLADLLTPAAERVLAHLEPHASGRSRWRPPEASGRATAGWDSWALCQILWVAAMTKDPGGSGAHRLEVPDDGLDKVAVATMKDRALARLAGERTNARFRGRLTERLGAVLNRGLSRDAEPSPPFRFLDPGALLPRLQEVTALISPRVEEVGRVLLATGADTSGTFQGGEGVAFAVSVGCTPGVSDHDDVVCGLQLVDLDASGDGRVPLTDAQFKVGNHPSGRMRFQFTLPKVGPGRYRVKVAFSIKDGIQEPQVAEGRFEVRPPPGYVPPPVEHEEVRGTTLSFPRGRGPQPPPEEELDEGDLVAEAETVAIERREEALVGPRTETRPRVEPVVEARAAADPVDGFRPSDPGFVPSDADLSDPGAEIIEGLFPRPIAPPEDDVEAAVQQQAARAPLPVVEVELEETEASYATAQGGGAWSAGHRSTATDSGAPSRPTPVAFAGGVEVPRPSLAMPRPGIAAGPPAAPPPTPPSLSVPSSSLRRPEPVAAAVEEAFDEEDWHLDDAAWGALPGSGADFEIEQDALPHSEGEDLPSWRQGELPFDTRSIPGLDRLIELVQRDSYTAFVAAVAGCFVLLLACMALLRAC